MSPSFARDRLTALLGMLGSDHDGEVVNAGRLATRLVRSAGLTWNEVVVRSLLSSPPPPLEVASPPPPDWRARVAACRAFPDRLTAKEADFLANLAIRTSPPTPKQEAWLAGIEEKVLS
jgi:hypothetical protein